MKNSNWIIIGIIAIIVLLFVGGAFWWLRPSGYPQREQNTMEIDQLKIEDIKVGDGVEAKSGNMVSVNYVGTLLNGTKFDSSYDRNQPFSFTLGEGRVIAGWDQGLVGMKVGGKRKLTIPPDLAYGSAGAGGVIGPNETLVFEVELLSVN